jgi:hypothetical protein
MRKQRLFFLKKIKNNFQIQNNINPDHDKKKNRQFVLRIKNFFSKRSVIIPVTRISSDSDISSVVKKNKPSFISSLTKNSIPILGKSELLSEEKMFYDSDDDNAFARNSFLHKISIPLKSKNLTSPSKLIRRWTTNIDLTIIATATVNAATSSGNLLSESLLGAPLSLTHKKHHHFSLERKCFSTSDLQSIDKELKTDNILKSPNSPNSNDENILVKPFMDKDIDEEKKSGQELKKDEMIESKEPCPQIKRGRRQSFPSLDNIDWRRRKVYQGVV